MNFIKCSLIGVTLTLLLSGCVPEQRIIWSPDGRQAVVMGREDEQQTLYLCDGDGSLSSKQLERVFRAAWRPDSLGLVLVRGNLVGQWMDVEPFLEPEKKAAIISTANTLIQGHAITNVAKFLSTLEETDNHKNAIKLYLKHHHANLLGEQKLEEKDKPVWVVVNTIQTATVQDFTVHPGRIIAGNTMPVWDLRISASNRTLAYTCGEVEDGTSPPPALYIVPLDGETPPKRIARNVSIYPDWSADGNYLIYAVGNNLDYSNELQLGSIARTKVADEAGNLLSDISGREELAGIIMNRLIRVRCMPDGGIVFSAFEINLPATANDMPEYMTLFKLHPSKHPIVSRLVPRNIEPYFSGEISSIFELSPDARHVAFVDSDKRVAVFTPGSGGFGYPKPSRTTDLPSWRSVDELCYIHSRKESSKSKKPDVVLYSLSETNEPASIISRNWPAALLKSLDP